MRSFRDRALVRNAQEPPRGFRRDHGVRRTWSRGERDRCARAGGRGEEGWSSASSSASSCGPGSTGTTTPSGNSGGGGRARSDERPAARRPSPATRAPDISPGGREAQGQHHVGGAEVAHESSRPRRPVRSRESSSPASRAHARSGSRGVHVPGHHEPQRGVARRSAAAARMATSSRLAAVARPGAVDEAARPLGRPSARRASAPRGRGSRRQREVVRQVQDGPPGQAARRPRRDVAGEGDDGQARFEKPVVEREERGQDLAAQAPRDLPRHERRPRRRGRAASRAGSGARLPLSTDSASSRWCRLQSWRKHDPGLAQGGAVDVGVGRGVAEVVDVEVRAAVRPSSSGDELDVRPRARGAAATPPRSPRSPRETGGRGLHDREPHESRSPSSGRYAVPGDVLHPSPPASPISARRAGGTRHSRSMASAMASGAGSATRPFSPSVTNSSGPPASVVVTHGLSREERLHGHVAVVLVQGARSRRRGTPRRGRRGRPRRRSPGAPRGRRSPARSICFCSSSAWAAPSPRS